MDHRRILNKSNSCRATAVASARSAAEIVVAIPVRNEEEQIEDCLRALALSLAMADGSVHCRGVSLLLNNCTDGTADVVRSLVGDFPCPLLMPSVQLPPARAHVGQARRLAAQQALKLTKLSPDACLLMTDADTRVDKDWVLRTHDAFARGADAVAGAVSYDSVDMSRLPAALRQRHELEHVYAGLVADLDALIDPVAHDPWPRHQQASGASLAVRAGAYRRCGGVPAITAGEDRALVAALKSSGARVRHDPAVRVITSGRLIGRAAGGAADTMAHWLSHCDMPCDARLEAAERVILRARWRAGLRERFERGDIVVSAEHCRALLIEATIVDRGAGAGTFESLWQTIEQSSPALAFQPLLAHDLPGEIAAARAFRADLLNQADVVPEHQFGNFHFASERLDA